MSVDVVTSLVLHPSLTADQHHNELLSMEHSSPSHHHHHHRTRKRGVLATNLLQLPVQHIATTNLPSSSPQEKGEEDQDEDDLDEEDSFYESRKPSLMSSLEDLTPEAVPSVQNRCITTTLEQLAVARGWQERENGSFPGDSPTHKIAVNRFTRRYGDEDPDRKSSDPLVKERGDVLRRNREDRQRCLSDSEKESKRSSPVVCEESSLDYSSTHGGDSGFDDCRPKLQITVPSHCATAPVLSSRRRRPAISPLQVTPPAFNLNQPQHSPMSITPEEQSSPVLPGSRKHSRRRQTLTKHVSLCSLGGSSDSYSVQSSLLDCSSTTTDVTDVLSLLGFGDFDDPQLIPDRFIPADISHARPSSMRQQSLLNLLNSSTSPTPSAPESDHASAAASMYSNEHHSPLSPTPRPESPSHHSPAIPDFTDSDFHLPLGATADNFLPKRARPSSPPPPSSQTQPPSEPAYSPATDPTISHYHPGYAPLEPVPEETASDLSPSPRWLSPRVSIDHSFDIAMGHLGACLSVNTAVRKRSLPNREGYRVSVESMVSEQDSIYFSVTSYDDDIAREKREREEMTAQLVGEDVSVRRRRKGVYEPPPQLLSWLDQQKIEDDSPEEQPWPFNETAHLRKSLSELMEAQAKLSTHGKSSNPWERPLSPTFSNKPSFDYAPTRRSSFGEIMRRRSCHMIPVKYHRKSLPGNCRFYPFHPSTPPPPLPEVPSEVEMIVTESPIQHGEYLPPGMTRSEAQGFKRECIQLRAELDVVQEKLKKSETLRAKEGKDFQRKISDAEEYLRSELYRQERRCGDLEEEVALCQREMKRLQTDTQLAVARGRESIREKKDLEIKELRHKMEEGNNELRKRVLKLEEECRQLHAKEKHLVQAANQQNLKAEVESLYKEVAVLKQQLNSEKQAHALLGRDKALELKKLRAKAQFDKDEALKMQKDALQKAHETEIAVLKKTLSQLPHHQVTTYATSPSKNRHELKYLQQEVDKNQQLLIEKESCIEELSKQLELLHKERLTLEKEMSSVLGKT